MKKQALTLIVAGLAVVSVHADAYKDAYGSAWKEERARKYEVAATSFLAASDIAPGPQQKAESLFRAGECFKNLKKYDKAVELFKKVAAMKNISAYTRGVSQLRIGQLLYWQKKYKESIAELQKVKDIKGAHLHLLTDAMLNCGYNYDRLKEYDKAEECYKYVLSKKTHPYHLTRAYIALGNDLRLRKKYDAAIAEFEKVPEVPKVHPNNVSEAYLNMGYVYREQKKYADAIAAFKKCIAVEKGHPHHQSSAQINMGHALRDQKKYEEAIKAYSKTYDMPKAHPFHYAEADRMIGYCYWDLKDYGKAKEYFEKVMAAKNTWPWQKNSAKNMLKAIAQKLKK